MRNMYLPARILGEIGRAGVILDNIHMKLPKGHTSGYIWINTHNRNYCFSEILIGTPAASSYCFLK